MLTDLFKKKLEEDLVQREPDGRLKGLDMDNPMVGGSDRFGRTHDFGSQYVVVVEDGQGNAINDPVPMKIALKREGSSLLLTNTEDIEIRIDHDCPVVVTKIYDRATGGTVKEQEFVGPVEKIRFAADTDEQPQTLGRP